MLITVEDLAARAQACGEDERGKRNGLSGLAEAKSADEALEHLRHIKEAALNIGQEVRGTLRLGVSNYIQNTSCRAC
jgi:hypothetical protein